MKPILLRLLACILCLALSGCHGGTVPAEATAPAVTAPRPPVTEPSTQPTAVVEIPIFVPSPPPRVLELTGEEKTMLLKIGMAERGNCGCTECIALVMRSVLNRVETGGFGRSIHGVLHAQDQYTPVADGTYYTAKPNESCYDALEMVLYGWDESRGALYYEWCEGESWHSQNLNLLFQHCDTRFYD